MAVFKGYSSSTPRIQLIDSQNWKGLRLGKKCTKIQKANVLKKKVVVDLVFGLPIVW